MSRQKVSAFRLKALEEFFSFRRYKKWAPRGPYKFSLLERHQYEGLESLLGYHIVGFSLVNAETFALLEFMLLGLYDYHSLPLEGSYDFVSDSVVLFGAGVRIKGGNYNLGLLVGQDFFLIDLSFFEGNQGINIEDSFPVEYIHRIPSVEPLFLHI